MDEKFQKQLWQYLSFEQLDKFPDPKLRAEYKNKRNKVVRNIIAPLYMYAIRNGFDDTALNNARTIREIMNELKKFYDSKNIKRDGVEQIIKESIRKK